MANDITYMKGIDRKNIYAQNEPITTTFNWDFVFTRLPDIITAAASANPEIATYANTLFGTAGVANEKAIFRLHTDSIQVPEPNLIPQPIVTRIRGFQQTQVGGDIPDYGQFAFVVQDFESQEIQKFMTMLAYLSCDPRTKNLSYDPLGFSFDCEFIQLSPTFKPLKKWICEKCNFLSISHGSNQFDASISGHGLTQISGSIDHYEIAFYNNGSWDVLGTNYTSTGDGS